MVHLKFQAEHSALWWMRIDQRHGLWHGTQFPGCRTVFLWHLNSLVGRKRRHYFAMAPRAGRWRNPHHDIMGSVFLEKNRTLQIPSKMDAEIDMPMGESARNVFIANSSALTGAWSLGCLDLICSRTWRQSWCFLSRKLASLLETIPYLKLTQSGCLLQRMNSVLNETKCWMNEKCIYMHRKTRLFRSI